MQSILLAKGGLFMLQVRNRNLLLIEMSCQASLDVLCLLVFEESKNLLSFFNSPILPPNIVFTFMLLYFRSTRNSTFGTLLEKLGSLHVL